MNLKKIGKLLLLAVLLGVVTLLLWPDQQLDPAAKAWMELEQPAFSEEQNSFFTLFGFLAPADTNPHTLGVVRAKAWSRASAAYRDSGVESDVKTIEQAFPSEPLPEDPGFDDLCLFTQQACLSWYAEHATEVTALSKTYARWLERYLVLYQKSNYHSQLLSTYNTPFPPLDVVLKIHKLRLAQLGVVYAEGKSAEALRGLAEDLIYVRALLAEGDNLVVKMTAVRMMANVLHLYSQFLDVPQVPPMLLQTVANLAPLNDAEQDMHRAMRHEFRSGAILYLALNQQDVFTAIMASEDAAQSNQYLSWYQSFVYKPHATVNLSFRTYSTMAEYGELSPAALLEQKWMLEENYSWFELASNPVGTTLHNVATPSIANYVLRLKMLNSLMNLLKLKAKLRIENVRTADVPEFLKKHGGGYPGLFADQPVQCKAECKTLFYPTPVDNWLQPLYRELRI